MELRLPYGKTYITATLPENHAWHIETIAPAEIAPADDPLAAVNAALDNPVGAINFNDFRGAESAAIAINDKTRPVPHAHLLPPLLARLEKLGISPGKIQLIIATGTHPVMPPDEYPMVLPENIIARYPVLCHDCEDEANLQYLGKTERETPVYVNKTYLEADIRLVVGNVEPHQFMGFSGGVKSAAIGLAGKTTINHNHAMMRAEAAQIGRYDDNPARQDVEEIGHLLRVDFALNALLNGKKQIVDVITGHPVDVMQTAIPRVIQGFQVPVAAPFDLMIVSPGGHPKDINVYQAQKGLAHAALVTKPGGTVILAAACPEGTGSQTYENWILDEGMVSHQAVFERFEREGFHIGAHKAFQISRDAARVRVLMFSDMDADFVRKLLLNPVENLQSALDAVLPDLPAGARIGIMPVANATIPALQQPV